MRFDVLTIFPHIFDSYLDESLMKRAREEGIIRPNIVDIRTFSKDRHRKVDDKPFGGGPGMVLKVDPIHRALSSLRLASGSKSKKTRVILFSTRGKRLDPKMAKRLAKYDRIVMICGRYEGVDERVAKHLADEEVSIGDYILSGGELPALILMETVSRFLPGFLGKFESLEEMKGSYPVYTRPEVYNPQPNKKWPVPKVLLSGDHKKIEAWRSRK